MWCDLPPELLDEVANRLDGPSDTWNLRSVCSSWRSIVPPRPLPVQLFPADIINFLPNSNHYNNHSNSHDLFQPRCHVRLAKHTFFLLSLAGASASASGWLIKTDEHKPGAFHLFSPFSRTSAQPFFQNPFKLDLTNVKIRELGYEYVLRNVHIGYGVMQDLHEMEHQKVALMILTSHNSHPAHHGPVNVNHEYVILSTHNTGKLLLYRSTLNEWSFLDDFTPLGYDDRSIFVNDWSLHYVDVVEYESTFYAVTNSGRTVAIKVGTGHEAEDSSSVSLTVTLLANSIIGGDKKCLVKSDDDLLMVDLYTCPTPGVGLLKVHAVDIFKLDTQEGSWVLVKTLGERALFLSNHSSFSASASTLPGCKPNFIYFYFKNFDKDFCCCERKKGDDGKIDYPSVWTTSDEIGVFDFEKGTLGSLEEYSQDRHLFSWPLPHWITSST